ncbi:MAG: hypothetical protein RL071_4266 [Pseudomonadota bacterium]|jgi:CRP-like cAMP-binding protein
MSALAALCARLGVAPDRVPLLEAAFTSPPVQRAAGDALWAAGQRAPAVELLEEGQITLELRAEPTGPAVHHSLRAPALLGLPSAIDGGARGGSARAAQPCALRALPQATLESALHGADPTSEALRELLLAAMWSDLREATLLLREHLRTRPA